MDEPRDLARSLDRCSQALEGLTGMLALFVLLLWTFLAGCLVALGCFLWI